MMELVVATKIETLNTTTQRLSEPFHQLRLPAVARASSTAMIIPSTHQMKTITIRTKSRTAASPMFVNQVGNCGGSTLQYFPISSRRKGGCIGKCMYNRSTSHIFRVPTLPLAIGNYERATLRSSPYLDPGLLVPNFPFPAGW